MLSLESYLLPVEVLNISIALALRQTAARNKWLAVGGHVL